MMKCPKCRRPTRVKVSLYLDIPATLANRLSKANLRDGRVRVEGAGWPSATYYCSHCGWTLRLGSGRKKR